MVEPTPIAPGDPHRTHVIEAMNVFIGSRITQRREQMELSLQQLGQMLDVSPFDVRRYESGVHQVSAYRLWQLGAALQVDAAFFLEGFVPPRPSRAN